MSGPRGALIILHLEPWGLVAKALRGKRSRAPPSSCILMQLYRAVSAKIGQAACAESLAWAHWARTWLTLAW